jgi:hypothetical protein
MVLSKDQILAAKDSQTITVDVPEWGGSVCLRPMSGTERDVYESDIIRCSETKNFKNIRAKLLVATLVDEQGNKLFDVKDIDALGAKSGKVLDRLFEEAKKLSGVSDKDVEQLEKN